MYRGLPVAGGGVSRQRVGTETVSAFGLIYTGIDLPFQPQLSAVAVTTAAATAAQVAPDSVVTLVVLPELFGGYRLTYRAAMTDGHIRFLDANTGDVLRTDQAYSHQSAVGTGQGVHGDSKKLSVTRVGSVFESRDQLRPAQTVTRSTQGTNATLEALFGGAGTIVTDSDNVWANPALVDAHVNAGLTYDYFHQRHGWQGVDGENSTHFQVVVDRASLENNAFFLQPSGASGSGLAAFGVSGAGVPITPIDVVGHELMHGVTFFSMRKRTGRGLSSAISPDGVGPTDAISGSQTLPCTRAIVTFSDGSSAPFFCLNGQYALVSNPGGATNEGFADVFGTAVEFFHQQPGTAALRADYLIAEDTAVGGPPAFQGWRSLNNPSALAVEPTGTIRYPDHFSIRLRYPLVVVGNTLTPVPFPIVNGRFVTTSVDNGGVHYNATIFGHIFYLAVEGGQNRTSGQSVQGVGAANRAQIERVFFRAMTVLMPEFVSFPTVGLVLRQAAIDLYGSGSAPHRAVDQAASAAGL